jgi:precorrin-6A/cobalt-precorrin-6A reductase
MRVLILGGTTEASAIARALAGDARFEPVLSLAGRTRSPVPPPIPWRTGGFGGVAGLAAYLRQEAVDAVIDATHPFAAQMKAHAAEACGSIPHITVLRPPWEAVPDDRWLRVATMTQAAAALGPVARRVFLTVGQGELAPFGPPHDYLVRTVDPPADAPAGAVVLTARGPFTAEDDRALMLAHGTELLVTKNSGGTAVAGKLAAARALGITVVMVDRPPAPQGPTVPDAASALRWLEHQAALLGV